jgi:modulator of FtsH protease
MLGYAPDAWTAFFTAMIAAAAALTGLLFVAVSINLALILKDTKLRSAFLLARAAETLATLLLIVTSSALALVPQSTRLLGLEIAIVVVPMLAITVRSQLHHRRQNSGDPLTWTISRMAGTAVATIPCAVAGFSLALHAGGGFYWLASAALLGIVGAVYNAWVLLVEIVR